MNGQLNVFDLARLLLIIAGGYFCGKAFADWLGGDGWFIGSPIGAVAVCLLLYLLGCLAMRQTRKRHREKSEPGHDVRPISAAEAAEIWTVINSKCGTHDLGSEDRGVG